MSRLFYVLFMFLQDITFVNLQHENSNKYNVGYFFSLDDNWALFSKPRP